ncbi:MAG: hypothetical protein AB2L14_00105 [Candidatus Xenobiia bacterium LiM19]
MAGSRNDKAATIWTTFLILLAVLIFTPGTAWAGNTATVVVSFKVTPISSIEVSGEPQTLEVFPNKNGDGTYEARDVSTTYSFYTNERRRVITGAIDQPTPDHTRLKVQLTAPSGGSSAGDVTLTTVPRVLVSGMGKERGTNLPIVYTFSATREAGKVPLTRRTIVYTITGE